MKLVKLLPYNSQIDDTIHEVAVWELTKEDGEGGYYGCEFANEPTACDTSGLLYGTGDEMEPKFCARHFYQEVVSGDGVTNYKLVEEAK